MGLQRIEEGQDKIGGLESRDRATRWSELRQRPLFCGEIRLDIHVSCFDAFMPQPQRDNGDIDAGLKQVRRSLSERGAALYACPSTRAG